MKVRLSKWMIEKLEKAAGEKLIHVGSDRDYAYFEGTQANWAIDGFHILYKDAHKNGNHKSYYPERTSY